MVNVSAIVASAFIGAVATGLITLVIRELRGVLNTRRRRERFRESLIGEIEAGMNNVGATYVDQIGGEMVPTSVFDTGTDNLGLLTEKEIQSVTAYYASAEKINALSSRISLNPDEVATDEGEYPDDPDDPPLAQAYYSERDRATTKGSNAVSDLQENKSEIGFRAYMNEILP